jgi:hypothetical protein
VDAPFESLDFIYTPSSDVAADARYFSEVLGAAIVFAIEDGTTRVAMMDLTGGPPHLLFTDHLEGERPIFIYRVADLKKTLKALTERGWERASTFEIPHGPCCSFETPAGHRVAVYQLTRRDVARHFEGRRDF